MTSDKLRWQRDTRGHYLRVVESGWNFLQTQKTFDKQSGASEKNERKHNLDYNEARARPAARSAFTGTASSLIH